MPNRNHDGIGEKTTITDKTRVSIGLVIALIGAIAVPSLLVIGNWYDMRTQYALQSARDDAHFARLEAQLSRTITDDQFNEWRELLNEQNNTIKVPRLPDRRAGLDMKRPEED